MVGLVSVAKKAGRWTTWISPQMRCMDHEDVQLDQYGEFIKTPPPGGYDARILEKFVDGGKPVKWSHLHPTTMRIARSLWWASWRRSPRMRTSRATSRR